MVTGLMEQRFLLMQDKSALQAACATGLARVPQPKVSSTGFPEASRLAVRKAGAQFEFRLASSQRRHSLGPPALATATCPPGPPASLPLVSELAGDGCRFLEQTATVTNKSTATGNILFEKTWIIVVYQNTK